jgi:mono/diheme cytochrome c family protein
VGIFRKHLAFVVPWNYYVGMNKIRISKYLLLAIFTVSFAAGQTKTIKRVPAQPTAALDGKTLFSQYCAVCHGVTGKGDGPAADALKSPVPDLTHISNRNGGKFPELRMLELLKTGSPSPAHGSEEMPVWGPVFRSLSQNAEIDQLRIHAVLNYLEEIQAK